MSESPDLPEDVDDVDDQAAPVLTSGPVDPDAESQDPEVVAP